jgi:hypothetical protein
MFTLPDKTNIDRFVHSIAKEDYSYQEVRISYLLTTWLLIDGISVLVLVSTQYIAAEG